MRLEENISAEEPWPQRAGERGKRWRRMRCRQAAKALSACPGGPVAECSGSWKSEGEEEPQPCSSSNC